MPLNHWRPIQKINRSKKNNPFKHSNFQCHPTAYFIHAVGHHNRSSHIKNRFSRILIGQPSLGTSTTWCIGLHWFYTHCHTSWFPLEGSAGKTMPQASNKLHILFLCILESQRCITDYRLWHPCFISTSHRFQTTF